MTYSRAGHSKLLRMARGGATVTPIESSGIALGIISQAEDFSRQIEEVSIPLVTGDSFLAYTDGVSEANNVRNELYGLPRLMAAMRRCSGRSAEDLLSVVLDDVRQFGENEPAHDDVTMFAMKVEA